MIRIYFIIFNLLALVMLYSQTTPSIRKTDRGYFGIYGGLATPVGPYASKSGSTDDSNGYAKPGADIGLDFTFKFSAYDGIAFLFRSLSNPVDAKAIEAAGNSGSNQIAFKATINKPWKIYTGMLGWYRSFSFDKKGIVCFDLKFMLGQAFVSTDDENIIVNKNGNAIGTLQVHSASSNGFAYLVGVGPRFNITKQLCLMLQVEYFATKMDFKNEVTTTGTVQAASMSYTQKIANVNYNVGLCYRIN